MRQSTTEMNEESVLKNSEPLQDTSSKDNIEVIIIKCSVRDYFVCTS